MNFASTILAILMGEIPAFGPVEKADVRVERPRRERQVRVRPAPMPRHGFRGTMRGLK